MYVPTKGRQGENHISMFSKFMEGGRDDEFWFLKKKLIIP
jgi:hypothetical protein